MNRLSEFWPIPRNFFRAPGNGAAIGGLKVVTANGWFAARPSGTENVYKIYAESFRDTAHLRQIQDEAQSLVGDILAEWQPKKAKELSSLRSSLLAQLPWIA